MILSGILNSATHALGVNQQALRTTSNNIANVNTPGYVRQRVNLEATVIGDQSSGVEISSVQRMVDKFLAVASRSATSDASKHGVMSDYYDRFESLLGNPNDNSSVSGKLDRMFAELSSLSGDPSAPGARQNTLATIENFSNTVSKLASSIQDLRAEVSGQIENITNKVNNILRRIDELNPKIVSAKATGGDSGGLEEQQSRALAELSELIDIQVGTNDNGSVHVSTSTGVPLIDIRVHELQYNPPGTITSGTLFPPITLHPVSPGTGKADPEGAPLDAGVVSGELRGLLDMRDSVLPDFAAELGTLASQAIDRLNAVHNENTAYPPPNSLTGTQTGMLGTDAHGFTGQAHFAVVDAAGMEVDRATIDFDSYAAGTSLDDIIADVNAGLAGNATLSLMNGVMQFTAADSAHGVTIVQDDAAPSDRAGRGFSHFFGMNDLLQSATPSHADMGISGGDPHGFTPGGTLNLQLRGPNGEAQSAYTLTVGGTSFDDLVNDLNASPLADYMSFSLNAEGGLDVTPESGYENYKLFSAVDGTSRGATGVSLSRFFGIGEANAANAANDVQLVDSVAHDSQRLAVGKYDLNAGAGDPVITIGDGRGAQALADVADTKLSFEAAGKLNGMQATLSQYGVAFLSNAALQGESVANRSADAEALAANLDEKLSNKTGVNMDEELSNLLIYQNAYSASARIVTTVQEMMDTLINMMR